jgi:hypothetical protein
MVTMRKVEDWLLSAAKSAADSIIKEGMMTS